VTTQDREQTRSTTTSVRRAKHDGSGFSRRRSVTWRFERWLGTTWPVRNIVRLGLRRQLWWVPSWPAFVTDRYGTEPPIGPRSLEVPPVPSALIRVPGNRRDPELEQASWKRGPIPYMDSWFPGVSQLTRTFMWKPRIQNQPKINRALRAFAPRGIQPLAGPTAEARSLRPEQLSALVKAKAAELGLSAVGAAAYDEKYVWDTDQGGQVGDVVIVCVLEQHYEATQSAPSNRAERAALASYAGLMPRSTALAEFLRDMGYAAKESDPATIGVGIHYGVEAGLGQLGMNGQLLTPFAGSRCRITMINTNAPLALDKPVDYGITGLCEECRVCVQRCPTGAIPSVRKFHRGVEKAKIKPQRCAPMVAQVQGCAVCMKVCPVQKYGLPKVLEHYDATGEVLGKGTDELEGYDWPDGRHFGPGQKPREAVSMAMLEPGGRKLLPVIPWPD
jgi:epoxyqueuosine reductase